MREGECFGEHEMHVSCNPLHSDTMRGSCACGIR